MAGTVRDGRTGTFNQTVGVKLDMDDAIDILTPDDVPLQQWMGDGDRATQVKVEWLEEDLTPQDVVIASKTGTGPWTATVDDASILRDGDILQEKDNTYSLQWVVSSPDTSANTAVLTGFAGNATGPTDGATLSIIGQYNTEGGDPKDPRSVERTAQYNYTQIGQEQVSVTRTAGKRALYGQDDPYDHELMKKFRELAIRFERSLVSGVRTISGDAQKRFMGGLLYFITTNTSSDTAANSYKAINALLRKCYEAGGTPRTLMVSPAVKAAISANVDPTLRRSDRSETTGGYVIERVISDFGEVDIVLNRHFPKTKGLVLQREYIRRRPFDPYFHEMLAKTGDSESGEVVGEFSLEVKNEKAHGVLTITDAA
jgi:hypothetical protein